MESQNIYKCHLPDWLLMSGLFYVVITDMEGKYLYVNDFFSKRFTNYDDSYDKKYFTDTVVVEDVQKAIETARACILNPNQAYLVDLKKPLGKGKSTINSRWTFSLLTKDDGTPIGIFSIGYEISDKEEVSSDLAIKLCDLSLVFKNSADAFLLLDSNQKILSYNKSAQKFLGLKFMLEEDVL
ncbi:hypothetical protein Belba_2333 [Belliella baltica DSM 15883]|uniref:PAS domain-containing protein n=1 Tax=Belliella baltica (strain DSM 15883 / CIP 108006 / LMG 21964 / BA134) TaxID=866536 RepID=I3Z6M5_BELBD|nr:PAS domain-containing protein [Belliella baltica]AFL84893.1 hypothetical protein Belba_2333 [Belliella baltica DSM 15883]